MSNSNNNNNNSSSSSSNSNSNSNSKSKSKSKSKTSSETKLPSDEWDEWCSDDCVMVTGKQRRNGGRRTSRGSRWRKRISNTYEGRTRPERKGPQRRSGEMIQMFVKTGSCRMLILDVAPRETMKEVKWRIQSKMRCSADYVYVTFRR